MLASIATSALRRLNISLQTMPTIWLIALGLKEPWVNLASVVDLNQQAVNTIEAQDADARSQRDRARPSSDTAPFKLFAKASDNAICALTVPPLRAQSAT